MNERYIPIEKLLHSSDGSIFKLTILAAKRAFELYNGAKPLIDKPKEKVLNTALCEIMESKVRLKKK